MCALYRFRCWIYAIRLHGLMKVSIPQYNRVYISNMPHVNGYSPRMGLKTHYMECNICYSYVTLNCIELFH